ncbi:lytic transglycosylase domain-containing protein [Roseomonas chloroacetimidivorans]|uniref:lytic transglycosylase domain-containing protein n=1 Tax=Roseomonas chloroacetimidivorans TaxID=1766656 RepID=UPI003C73F91D
MRLAASLLTLALSASPALARDQNPSPPSDASVSMVTSCLSAAAAAHRLPPGVLVVLLNVEGGRLGRVSQNTNDTVDIGPMQINQIWIPAVARHWRASQAATRDALLNNFCANVEAGAWILRTAIDEAHGDFWEGVGLYHSHSTQHKTTYLRLVLRQALRLQGAAARSTAPRQFIAEGG